MTIFQRFPGNPILSPNSSNDWESKASYNASPMTVGDKTFLIYRAQSPVQAIEGNQLELSTIGCAESTNLTAYTNRRQLITPTTEWDKFGCEDPRVTKFEDTYYIFYTALSVFPFAADGIKVAVALTKDFQSISEKHLVTPFNAKAMVMFPERVNGKITLLLSANTDRPPGEIAIAQLERIEQLWDKHFWEDWYDHLDAWTLPLLRSRNDQVEVGAVPIKTEKGWLFLYSYIHNYQSQHKTFTVEAALLDIYEPRRILSRTRYSLLSTERDYEKFGQVPNVVFPSGALVKGGDVGLFYGAADTSACLATASLDELLQDLDMSSSVAPFSIDDQIVHRYSGNPIISPIPEHDWESAYTFNPTAVSEAGKVHILYRAMGQDDTSVIGYASSKDGFTIDERLPEPIYVPRAAFEKKLRPGNSGCEDARLTRLGDRFYMFYTAYDGEGATRVAMSSIAVSDFLAHRWNWDQPKLISKPDVDDKNSAIFPEKIHGQYAVFHRVAGSIWLDLVPDLDFGPKRWLEGDILISPRPNHWDSEKVGIAGPPHRTPFGWLLIYHGLSHEDMRYRLSAVLLDLDKPKRVLVRLRDPILEPTMDYENTGFRPGTVFSCGSVIIKDKIFIYYGGGDTFTNVAEIDEVKLLKKLRAQT